MVLHLLHDCAYACLQYAIVEYCEANAALRDGHAAMDTCLHILNYACLRYLAPSEAPENCHFIEVSVSNHAQGTVGMSLVACLGRSGHLVGAPCKRGAHAALVILCGVGKLELRIGCDDSDLPQVPACKQPYLSAHELAILHKLEVPLTIN